MIKLLIADDHAVVREGIKQIISDNKDMKILDTASDGNEVLNKLDDHDFDIIILDITMPGQSGLELLKQIKVLKPNLPVLILSMHSEEQYAIRVLKAGAAGYLNKDSAPEKLIEAIIKISNGGRYVSEALSEQLLNLMSGKSNELPHQKLSDREFQVLVGIGKGKSTSQMAKDLVLSEKTISTYRSRIMEKLNFENTVQIVKYIIEQKLD